MRFNKFDISQVWNIIGTLKTSCETLKTSSPSPMDPMVRKNIPNQATLNSYLVDKPRACPVVRGTPILFVYNISLNGSIPTNDMYRFTISLLRKVSFIFWLTYQLFLQFDVLIQNSEENHDFTAKITFFSRNLLPRKRNHIP